MTIKKIKKINGNYTKKVLYTIFFFNQNWIDLVIILIGTCLWSKLDRLGHYINRHMLVV